MLGAVRLAALTSGVALATQTHTVSFLSRDQQVLKADNIPEHDGAWYSNECDKINSQCEAKKERLRREYQEDLAELKAEWEQQQVVLSEKKDKHTAEKRDVVSQKSVVKAEHKDVQEAKKAVQEKAHCPADLTAAEAELSSLEGKLSSLESRLAALEAKKDQTAQDVDEECDLRKQILNVKQDIQKQKDEIVRIKACVEEFKAAQKVLSTQQDEHADETANLSKESAEEDTAAGAVPPQDQKVADAKAAYEAFKARGVRGIDEVNEECQSDRDALERQADDDVRLVEGEFQNQKRIYGDTVDTHKDEQADVAAQERRVEAEHKDVEAAAKQVAEARSVVKESEHCPAELETAEARLQALQSVKNTENEHVDEECELRKKILELKACVERLRAAEATLAKRKDLHESEKAQHATQTEQLGTEQSEERKAAGAVPVQQSKVHDWAAAVSAAKAARASICKDPNARAPAPPPAPKKKEEPKSGAERNTVTIAVIAVLLSSFMRA